MAFGTSLLSVRLRFSCFGFQYKPKKPEKSQKWVQKTALVYFDRYWAVILSDIIDQPLV